MQLHTDARLRGRVMALYMMIFMGGTPFGAPFIGWIGEASAPAGPLSWAALLTIAGVALASLLFARARGVTMAGLQAQPVPHETAA